MKRYCICQNNHLTLKRVRYLIWITFLLLGIISGSLILAFILLYYGQDLPSNHELKNYRPTLATSFYTKNNEKFYEYAKQRRFWVPLGKIPKKLQNAFLAAEDKNFYQHVGIDFSGVIRSIVVNTFTNSWQRRPLGASTITQQLAKNIFVGNECSMQRKIKEAILAFRIETCLSKDRILELYLNEIYLGEKSYGVAAAAKTYFQKQLSELTVDEMAFLAALPKAPSLFHPHKNPERTLARRNWVLSRMYDNKMISFKLYKQALTTNIKITSQIQQELHGEYFAEEIIRMLGQKFGNWDNGFNIYTTLDGKMQKLADKALKYGLEEYDYNQGWRGPLNTNFTDTQPPSGMDVGRIIRLNPIQIALKNGQKHFIQNSQWLNGAKLQDVILVRKIAKDYYACQTPLITGGIVALDADTGNVLAISGGYSFDFFKFNAATMAQRQIGSTFKPFIYAAALEAGFSPDAQFLDTNMTFTTTGKGLYTPKNYDRKTHGVVSMRTALKKSFNLATLRVALAIGMPKVQEMSSRFGINISRDLSMILGAGSSTLLNLTAAYAAIANGGYRVYPRFIEKIESQTRKGDLIFLPHRKKQILSKRNASDLKQMLEETVTSGTANRLKELDLKHLAGKTGSTINDAWFVGFYKNLVVGVFVGFPIPKALGRGQTGSRVALPIFKKFMQSMLQNGFLLLQMRQQLITWKMQDRHFYGSIGFQHPKLEINAYDTTESLLLGFCNFSINADMNCNKNYINQYHKRIAQQV